MTYVITAKCQLHKECIDVCPVTAISIPDGSALAVIDPDLCTECGECATVCPVGAPVPEDEA
jgi:ferredoxin